MSANPEKGEGPVEVKMEEGNTGLEKNPDVPGGAAAPVEQATADPPAAAASPAPSSASSAGRPPYIPQFSASTQMILQRINGRSAGGLSSALSSASAVAKTIEQSTFEDARRRLVMNMNTSLTMPLPAPKTPSNPPTPATSLPLNDAFQLRTPSVAKPAASKGTSKVPAKRGKPTTKGTKRKRSKGGPDDSSSLSDLPRSELEDASKDQAPPTMTKSGRQVQKPTQFNPTSPATGATTQKRRHYGKRTPEQALCKVCTRGLSPLKNQIVFCDGCNLCWHQLCHDPYIDDDFVSNESRSWFCGRCLAKRERHLAKKKSLDGFRGVSWAAKSAEQVRPVIFFLLPCPSLCIQTFLNGRLTYAAPQRRAYLSTVPHGQLVNLLMYSLELHPELPIFPNPEPGPPSKRASQSGAAVGGAALRADVNASGPVHYSRDASTPGRGVGAAEARDQAARESSAESVPPSWPKVGKGCLAGLKINEDDLRDKDDFEAFSVTTYNAEGRKVVENGMPVEPEAGAAQPAAAGRP